MRLLLVLMVVVTPAFAQGQRISVVAAENVYGDVAAQLGGPAVFVTSILSNPSQDPHMFEASPSTARGLAAADIVVSNGAGYDPWMAKLLRASQRPKGAGGREEIVVGALLHRADGGNPHLWYDPAAMPAFAAAFAAALDRRDPAGATDHAGRLATFLATQKKLDERIAALRTRFAGTSVTATEPVVGLLASALGLSMRNERFQLAVMNGTEARISDVVAFEADLREHRVRALFTNGQVDTPGTRRLLALARRVGVPVIPVNETEPAGTTYQAWMTATLDAVERALAPP